MHPKAMPCENQAKLAGITPRPLALFEALLVGVAAHSTKKRKLRS